MEIEQPHNPSPFIFSLPPNSFILLITRATSYLDFMASNPLLSFQIWLVNLRMTSVLNFPFFSVENSSCNLILVGIDPHPKRQDTCLSPESKVNPRKSVPSPQMSGFKKIFHIVHYACMSELSLMINGFKKYHFLVDF